MNIGKLTNKNAYAIGFFMILIVCGLLEYLFILNPIIDHNPLIEYKGISLEDMAQIKQMISEVKPLYLNTAKRITFINDSCNLNIPFYGPAGGVNSFMGYITIKWTDDMDWNRKVICHELSHNFLLGKEKFTYDLQETYFCFEDIKCRCTN